MNKKVLEHFKKEHYGERDLNTIRDHLNTLGVSNDSAFAEFYLLGKAGPYFSDQDTKDLEDLNEVVDLTHYVADEFNVPHNYISLGSTDGESLLLYNKDNEAVYYIDWNQVQDLLQENIKPTWNKFEDYLIYYFS